MVKEKVEGVSKKEMYELLLKDYEEMHDEGRDAYLEELIAKIRKELEEENEL